MDTHYNPETIKNIEGKYLVIDNNILSDLSSDVKFFDVFIEIFSSNPILIDPIVKLEFLRGAYIEKTYKEKGEFLKLEKFYSMADHQEIYKQTYENAFNIARIYSHKKKPKVPLGDILITARLSIQQQDVFFITEDAEDFNSLLFDRVGILTFERKNRDGGEYLMHVQILKFNLSKYDRCLKNLPQ